MHELSGRLTSGGSIANFDALWAARRTQAIVPALLQARLPCRSVQELSTSVGGPLQAVLQNRVDAFSASGPQAVRYLVQLAKDCKCGGCMAALRDVLRIAEGEVPIRSKVLCSSASHQSIEKAAAALGFQATNVIPIPLNARGEMHLPALQRHLRGSAPICSIIAIFGTTDLGATDDIGAILATRRRRRAENADAFLHVDGAWGGYYLSAAAAGGEPRMPSAQRLLSARMGVAREQVGRADCVTIDPHKGTFSPYPAGALVFRCKDVMSLLEHRSPVLNHDRADPSLGRAGVDGSRPGSSAVTVAAVHASLKLTAAGLGARLGRVTATALELSRLAEGWRDPTGRLHAAAVLGPGGPGKQPRSDWFGVQPWYFVEAKRRRRAHERSEPEHLCSLFTQAPHGPRTSDLRNA